MKDNISRVIIETVVKSKLRDIKESPERSVRNLVDMALQFSEGRFQKYFFEIAQQILENPSSAYYAIIRDVVASVSEERLLTFGMNLGYNSCTAGAQRIREIEQRDRYNIPWSVSLELTDGVYEENHERYHSIVSEGETLGIYTWLLFAGEQPQAVLPLAAAFPEHAFVIFCDADGITYRLIDEAKELPNIMFAVHYEPHAEGACQLLRENEFLYSVYMEYYEGDLDDIRSGDLFRETAMLHPLFTMLLPEPECSPELRQEVYRCVLNARTAQEYQTAAWDMIGDNSYVDSIISEGACTVGFDHTGAPQSLYGQYPQTELNLFSHALSDILKTLFPKESL